jgi:acetyl esterase/lipase
MIMKKMMLAGAFLFAHACLSAQPGGGFGGFQRPEIKVQCSEKFSDINYAGDGEAYHTLDIYLPQEERSSYPVVIHIYGSAWFSNNSKGAADLSTICQALLNAGYAVVTPNHRASTDAKFPAQINDIKAVVRFVRGEARKYHFDTAFVGISGFSSGGHLASLAAVTNGMDHASLGDVSYDIEGTVGSYTSLSSQVNAACDWSGPVDLPNMDCGEKMKMDPSPEEVLIGLPLTGNETRYVLASPVTFADADNVPIHIFHGKTDNVVPVCQGQRFYEALRTAEADCGYTEVPEGGHGFNMYTEENLARMVSFFDRVRTTPARIAD